MTTDRSTTASALPVQPGALGAPPVVGCSLTFRLAPDAEPRAALTRFAAAFDVAGGIVGLGEPLVRAVGATVAGLRAFPAIAGPAGGIPSTQQALWLFLRGADRGALFDATTNVRALLDGPFVLDDALDTFTYAGGRDLTGYVDGTENPKDAAALAAAVISDGDGMRGSCFVAVQRWLHDLTRFRTFPPSRRDHVIGRAIADNAELPDAPATAHVKRAAQESFDPAAFIVRRSMPWASADAQGLEFVAYVESLDRFERILRRMVGLEDGVVDALFSFSRPLTGGYYWCPPITADNRLDLGRLAL